MELKRILTNVKRIAKSASKLCFVDFNIEYKEGENNIVTSADKAVQMYLDKKLKALITESAFFQEEQEENSANAKYIWIIDPIDGTENFTRGIKDFCISIALAIDGEIVLGVVYMPKTKEMFSAYKGGGAFLNNSPIHVSTRKLNQCLFATALCLYRKEYASICNDILNDMFYKIKDFRRFGSLACELCYLAKGDIDLFFEIRVFLWDYAAGLIILKEAGGEISSSKGRDLKLGNVVPVVAANNKENMRELLSSVDKYAIEDRYI